MRNLDRDARALVTGELDDAQVRDARHGQPGDARQGVFVLERRGQGGAGFEQKCAAALRGLELGARAALGLE